MILIPPIAWIGGCTASMLFMILGWPLANALSLVRVLFDSFQMKLILAAAIGVANERMHLVMAEVLSARGVDGFVFRGDDGLDEITLATTTSVLTIGSGEMRSDRIDPLDFEIKRAPISALVGGDATENARITTAIFAGEKGAPRDAVVLNAAAAIAAYEARFDLSLHQRMACRRSGDAQLREAGDAAGMGRTIDHAPRSVLPLHLDDGEADGGKANVGLFLADHLAGIVLGRRHGGDGDEALVDGEEDPRPARSGQ